MSNSGSGMAAPRRRSKLRRTSGIAVGALLLLALANVARAGSETPKKPADNGIDRVCTLIAAQADLHALPRDFLARLIWKESRFDADAVSPAGAEGIAQFMPGTAKLRGLADSFDIGQAIPASAAYLADLKHSFGNLGLAAAAYNAGENRVSRWLASGGFLPIETEDYVLDILGEAVDNFTDRSHRATIRPLEPGKGFERACRDLPVVMATTVPMSSINVKPWGIQIAGNFRRSAAIRHWQRVRDRFPKLLADYDPVVSRVRTPIGRRGIYAVRIGADDRKTADGICAKLQSVGGACVVMRNR
jgi:soluble lytic murein transglycosylase-like protein